MDSENEEILMVEIVWFLWVKVFFVFSEINISLVSLVNNYVVK